MQDAHPLPRVDDLLDSLNNNKLFSTLDLLSGYWHVSMTSEDREKTAFITPGGLFEFLGMPYGLSTAPATFSKAVSIILSGLTYEICLCYFDDAIRWLVDLQEFDFTISHRPGSSNQNADALSRLNHCQNSQTNPAVSCSEFTTRCKSASSSAC